jgi:lysosomal alpha-mannosidase
MYYPGHRGNNSEFEFRASGAYIFRPAQDEPIPLGNPTAIKHVSNDLVDELHVAYNVNWARLVIRTYKQQSTPNYIEADWAVGPIPIEDSVGKEVIIRYTTDIQNDGVFYTDANGRQLVRRVRNYRPTYDINMTEPTAQNYYPVNAKILIEDEAQQLAVLTDRSEGGASIVDGTVELMLHRRLLDDDAFGVGEALNEAAFGAGLVAKGRHRWILTTGDRPAAVEAHRAGALDMFYEPLVVFSSPETSSPPPLLPAAGGGGVVALAAPLPPSLHLLTLERTYPSHDPFGDYVLLRLEHIYQAGEHPVHSAPAEVDLALLFTGTVYRHYLNSLFAFSFESMH